MKNPDKEAIKQEVINSLKVQQAILQTAVKSASEATTHADARQEGKYDTRAVESSYLAGAQSERLLELNQRIHLLEKLTCPVSATGHPVTATSVIHSIDENANDHWHMILPGAAGTTILWQGLKIIILSPESLLGAEFLGKFPGEDIEITIDRKIKCLSIKSVY